MASSSSLKNIVPLLPGFHTRRKILVIESDDWGSIRTRSKQAYEILLNKGYPLDANPFSKYDALESHEDLSGLLDCLASIRNGEGISPKMTLNYITANPDFPKIKASDYQTYSFETTEETIRKYPHTERLNDLYEEGIRAGLVRPQLHGREHLNIRRWLRDLQASKKYLLDAFDLEMFSLKWGRQTVYANEYMDAFDLDDKAEIDKVAEVVKCAAKLFQARWGFVSKSFIACCYIWHGDMNEVLQQVGVRYLQGLAIQHEPKLQAGLQYNSRYHFTGQKNNFHQTYLVRNAFFEPSVHPNADVVNNCLNRIALAFKWGKPAIISSHRLNFIGRIFPENRERNLRLFKELLQQVVGRWQDVEFMFSDELGNYIASKENVWHNRILRF